MDGKKTLSQDIIKTGKNLGRANATTKEEQALAEAKAKHTKQLKRGYVDNIEDAQSGKTDDVITGGYLPMLAKSFYEYDEKTRTNKLSKSAKHITFPCAAQPKLDGARGNNDKGALFSRTRKPIVSVPHIPEEIKALGLKAMPLDGELYNHKYKDKFEELIKLINKKKEIDPEKAKVIQYHVYDINMPGTFAERLETLKKLKKVIPKTSPIKIVTARIVYSVTELKSFYEECLERGYEGCMVRNLESPYKSSLTRSSDLQKLKEEFDDEFKVIGVNEGRGKYANNIGSFVCEVPEDYDEHGYRTFKAKPKGKVEYWREVYKTESWKGDSMMLTVRFQGLTKAGYVPRFPRGIAMRDMEFGS